MWTPAITKKYTLKTRPCTVIQNGDFVLCDCGFYAWVMPKTTFKLYKPSFSKRESILFDSSMVKSSTSSNLLSLSCDSIESRH